METIEFLLPDVGEGIASGEIVEWLAAEGDSIVEDEPLVEVQTDKAIVVIPSPATGKLAKQAAAVGTELDVGAVLALIETNTVASSQRTVDHEPAGVSAAAEPPPTPMTALAPGADRGESDSDRGAGPAAAPATRRLARELGVELGTVAGSGPGGRIVRKDVERSAQAAAAGAAEPAPSGVVPLRGVRRAIAQTLTHAWQTIPHVIDYREVDATALISTRAALKRQAEERGDEALAKAITPTPLLVKMAAEALRRHPYVNSSVDLDRNEITLHAEYNVGIATATDAGLVVPVIKRANERSITELAIETARLLGAARENRLTPADLEGGTFTVNNYGGLGIWLGTPIIKPPEVANLGVGALRETVVAVDGEPRVRPTIALAVSGDHRVLDGHTLAAFVSDFVALLEDPRLLLGELR